MKTSKILFLSFLFLVSGCGDSNENDEALPIPLTVPFLGYQDLTETIAGVDSNKNGIRDDIDRYISEEVPEILKKEAINFAMSLQKEVNFDSLTSDERIVQEMESSKSIFCLSLKELDAKKPGYFYNSLFYNTVNTPKRRYEYNVYTLQAFSKNGRDLTRVDCLDHQVIPFIEKEKEEQESKELSIKG